MSTPDKPKTPESEKIMTRFQAAMGKEGTQLARRVGDRFVSNINKDKRTRGQGRASADTAKARRIADRKSGSDITRIVKNASKASSATAQGMLRSDATALSDLARRKAAGNRSAVNDANSVTGATVKHSVMQTDRDLRHMHQKFDKVNGFIDLAGAVGSGMAQSDMFSGAGTQEVMTNPNMGAGGYNHIQQINPQDSIRVASGTANPFTMTA